MINEEWKRMMPFRRRSRHARYHVLSDEMADVSIMGLQWFILIPRLNHTGVSQAK